MNEKKITVADLIGRFITRNTKVQVEDIADGSLFELSGTVPAALALSTVLSFGIRNGGLAIYINSAEEG